MSTQGKADISGELPALDTGEFETTRVLLAQLAPARAPEDFASGVEGRIRRRSRGRFFDRGAAPNRWATLLGAGVVLVILLALYLMAQVAPPLRDSETGLTGEELRERAIHQRDDGSR